MIRFICLVIFRMTGWKYIENIPAELKSFVMIGAPHTSNYDFVPAMSVATIMKRNARFVIKKEWIKFPLNLLMVPAGAIGLDRNKIKESGKQSNTDLMAYLFVEIPDLVLMISPEGTRKPNEDWKTGFYYIAQKAGVPIVLGFADYKKKEAGLGMVIWPTNFEEDMQKISDFYRTVTGSRPENFRLDRRFP
jgi:1-acyl-sn-glycerol-3-phosphate acyltransferase